MVYIVYTCSEITYHFYFWNETNYVQNSVNYEPENKQNIIHIFVSYLEMLCYSK